MFGFGKKSRKEENLLSGEQKLTLADGLEAMLKMQMEFAPIQSAEVTKVEIKSDRINGKALGKIYDFVDCAPEYGQDIADVPVGIPILYHVLRALFPGQEAA